MHWDIWVCTSTKLGKAGEPEGVATAHAITRAWVPTAEEPEQPIYSLTYDGPSGGGPGAVRKTRYCRRVAGLLPARLTSRLLIRQESRGTGSNWSWTNVFTNMRE